MEDTSIFLYVILPLEHTLGSNESLVYLEDGRIDKGQKMSLQAHLIMGLVVKAHTIKLMSYSKHGIKPMY